MQPNIFALIELSEESPLVKRFGKDLLKIHKFMDIAGAKLLDEKCIKCSSNSVYCGHYDDGGYTVYYDNFWHICLDCLNFELDWERTSMGCETDLDLICLFCGRRV